MANQMIRNMRQDELRNLSSPSNQPNTNPNTQSSLPHNYRYQQRLNNIQSITDNIGIVYQNEKEDTTQIEYLKKYHNLRIYSQDRKWHLPTTDTFHNVTIYLGNSQTDTHKGYIQIPNTFQNLTSIYSPTILIPNLFKFQQEEIPPIIHLKINDFTFLL